MEEVNAISLATAPNIGFYVVATALAIVAPRAAALVYLVIAIVSVLRAHGDTTAQSPSTTPAQSNPNPPPS